MYLFAYLCVHEFAGVAHVSIVREQHEAISFLLPPCGVQGQELVASDFNYWAVLLSETNYIYNVSWFSGETINYQPKE